MKIVFLSETRADYGKIKSLVRVLDNTEFESHIFVCGMHLLGKYGFTYKEIVKDGFNNIFLSKSTGRYGRVDLALASVIRQFSNYVNDLNPDLIVVHGDRPACVAAAIVGLLNNIRVAHIEGGEVSGTIDESMRHAVSKLAHIHFVANADARTRLLQLGENPDSIYVIGSPDLDVMLNHSLPPFDQVKRYYGIPFDKYLIFIFSPVVTELDTLDRDISVITSALVESKLNFVVIFPNNDPGSNVIIKHIKKLKKYDNFRVFPSIRFESFLVLLKNCECMVGNSSAGIREAHVFGVPSIDIGTRQNGRYKSHPLIRHVRDPQGTLEAILSHPGKQEARAVFGDGNSAQRFLEILRSRNLWELDLQKVFRDI